MMRLDFNEDGYISREDCELMSNKLAEYSEMSEQEAESTYKDFMKVADALNLKQGVRIPAEQAAHNASEAILAMTPEEQRLMIHKNYKLLFNLIDTNNDGHISLEEFKVWFYVIAPELSESIRIKAFKAVDVDSNGEISCEEFLAAAEDYVSSVNETNVSEVLFGRLIDY